MTIHESDGDEAMGFTSLAEFEPLSTEEPLSEAEFAEEVRELVAEDAPRVFALVEEHGERDDAWVYAWGMAFEHRVEVISASGRLHATFTSVERAQRRFSQCRKIRLVWATPASPHPLEPVS